MTGLARPSVFPPFCQTGEKDPWSSSEFGVGWPETGLAPSRHQFNWVLWFATQAALYLCQRGIADWSSDETYQTGAFAIGPDKKLYRSKVDNNTGHSPASSATQWELFGTDVDGTNKQITLLGGIIIKWATLTGGSGAITWTFGTAFPTACIGVLPVPIVDYPTGYDTCTLFAAPTASAVTINRRSGSSATDAAGSFGVLAVAVGY